jgi:DNA polymerase
MHIDANTGKIRYLGRDSRMASSYGLVETYGGKLVENIVQAIARDILAYSLRRLSSKTKVVMHVHDEIVVEDYNLNELIKIMEAPIKWANGLILRASGFNSKYYVK